MSKSDLHLRKCVSCNEMKERSELFRLVKIDGIIDFDKTGKANGRGAYICRNKSCLDLAVKKKSFNRSLRCNVSEDVINKLYLELDNGCR